MRSGVGNPETDLFVVVAGVIVDADRKLRDIQKWLHSMVADYIHPEASALEAFPAR